MKPFVFGNSKFLVIALLVITVLLLGVASIIEAGKISDKELRQIKSFLEITNIPFFSKYTSEQLKEVLNLKIKPEKTLDLTYGILVLSALNEMDLIDMVISQRYKTEATDYFNQIINERTNLISYWKGAGADISKAISGQITGPMAALTLNAFAITNKTIAIFTIFNVLQKEKLYDGLWYYFDLRRSNETHQAAWDEAKILMGWAAEDTILDGNVFRLKKREPKITQLESQFAALWEKWGPYAEADGLSQKAKQEVKSELRTTLTSALETYNFAKEEPKPSLLEKAKLSLENLTKEVEKIKILVENAGQSIKNILIQLNPFKAAVAPVSEVPLAEALEIVEEESSLMEEAFSPEKIIPLEETVFPEEIEGPKHLTLAEIQENLDDISEGIEVINQETTKLVDIKSQTGEAELPGEEVEKIEEAEEEAEEEVEEEAITKESQEEEESGEIVEEGVGQEVGQKFCEKLPGSYPGRNKIIFNEIAWMGTLDDQNNEWFELKNISGYQINLSGWQILDKDKQIRIIFNSGEQFSANGFYLLERTDDDSVPGLLADRIYTGVFNNSDEALYLFDENCQLQDEVLANPDWSAGEKASSRSMERDNDLAWHTYTGSGQNGIFGTPKGENSPIVVYYGGGVPSPPPAEEPSSLAKILITEVQIASASSTNDEFIELYNPNDQEVDISQWSIQKSYSTSTTIYKKNFESGNKILPLGYFLIINASATDQNLLNLTDLTHKTFSLAENNIIYLVRNTEEIENASDAEIVDMLGFGENVFSEGSPASNPQSGESLGRKSTTIQDYMDTNNNQNDFELQEPSPKEKNKPKTEPENQPPVASFTFTPQNPFVDDEIIFDSSSSTDPDGQITSFIWDFGDGNSATATQATTTHSYLTSSQFLIQLLVQDNQGATSLVATTTTEVKTPQLAQSVVITEVQVNDKEFIELYNPTEEITSTANWYLSYFSANRDWNNPTITWEFLATSSIGSKSYYLIGIYGYPETGGNPNADWEILGKTTDQPYQSGKLSNDSGAIGIFSCDPSASTTDAAIDCKIDLFSWQEENSTSTLVFEESLFLFEENEIVGKSFQRKKGQGFYIDNYDNLKDFEIQIPSPENSKGEKGDVLPPNEISNFKIDEENSENNKIILTWLTTTDPDTPQENLSFKIYYSREEITEDNLDATSTLFATTSATTITILDLYYNSTYYFGIKAFDSWNYSSLSTSSLYQIPSAWINSSWLMFQHDPQRTGRGAFLGPNSSTSEIKVLIERDKNDYYEISAIDPNGILYLKAEVNGKDKIYAFYPDGNQKWLYEEIDNNLFGFSALGQDGSIYFYSQKGPRALTPAGNLKWENDLISHHYIDTNPVVGDDDFYIVSSCALATGFSTDCLVAFNNGNGEIDWFYGIEGDKTYFKSEIDFNVTSEAGTCSGDCGVTSPTIGPDGTIYFGHKNVLYAINSDGTKKESGEWPKAFEVARVRNGNLVTPSVDSDGTIYLPVEDARGISQGALYAINPDGTIKWEYGLGYILTTPVIGEGILYQTLTIYPVSYPIQYLNAIDSETGAGKWSVRGGGIPRITDNEGNIYSLSGSFIKAYNREEEEIWEVNKPGIRGTFALDEKGLYISGENLYIIIKE